MSEASMMGKRLPKHISNCIQQYCREHNRLPEEIMMTASMHKELKHAVLEGPFSLTDKQVIDGLPATFAGIPIQIIERVQVIECVVCGKESDGKTPHTLCQSMHDSLIKQGWTEKEIVERLEAYRACESEEGMRKYIKKEFQGIIDEWGPFDFGEVKKNYIHNELNKITDEFALESPFNCIKCGKSRKIFESCKCESKQ